ncbi:MAG: hypothetical protein MUF53_07415 [Gemmatimonadaceae bacterium]|jgi:hypothetical protein|nr:hypothetical protein [Gemmatimonadaceae bacterium]
MSRPAVTAEFTIETAAGTATARGSGSALVVEAPSLGVAESLLRAAMATPGGLTGAHALCTELGLGVRLSVSGREVALLGADAAPGLLQRLLHVPGQLKVAGWLAAILGASSAGIRAAFSGPREALPSWATRTVSAPDLQRCIASAAAIAKTHGATLAIECYTSPDGRTTYRAEYEATVLQRRLSGDRSLGTLVGFVQSDGRFVAATTDH